MSARPGRLAGGRRKRKLRERTVNRWQQSGDVMKRKGRPRPRVRSAEERRTFTNEAVFRWGRRQSGGGVVEESSRSNLPPPDSWPVRCRKSIMMAAGSTQGQGRYAGVLREAGARLLVEGRHEPSGSSSLERSASCPQFLLPSSEEIHRSVQIPHDDAGFHRKSICLR